MSHIVSLRSASLRALRSSSTIVAASKCTTSPHRSCQPLRKFSYSILSTSPDQNSTIGNNKNKKRTHSARTISIDSVPDSVYRFNRRIHTSPVFFDSVDVRAPPFPESVKEGTIRLLKKVGDKVSVDEAIAEIETDKANLSINAPEAGTIEAYLVADSDNVTSGVHVAKLNTSADAKPVSESKTDAPIGKVETKSGQSIEKPSADPAAHISLNELSPSAGAIRDTSAPQKPIAHPIKTYAKIDPHNVTGTRLETRVKMSRMRLKISERLKEAQNTCAMLTTFNEIDMSNAVEFRKKYADQFLKRHNIKLGFMSAFVKASACALTDSPIVNAVIDGNEIVYRDYVDISVAVASPKGLVVPVIRNVEKMNYADIERAINEYGEQAKKGTLPIEDMDGGTFTISNGGVFGSLFGTPIINLPQSAILGMHGIFDRPVAINGKMEIRPMMYVALTYDHRIIDGRDAVLFLRKIKQYVEDSRTMFLDI
ncbi:unnamed protein product [Rotaria socialis]|uniref:Dihydrolipoyllysine-residue succinyltransferase component of 2-oxoglutarate dehydrogenase complex, mitochondrial n=1 Tax=Rotaria socialis TaxID=392032 RepID=A0A817NXD5_9BILA|nr:unnamed protein product [Rotaria socialis]CAF3289690.1 unnamed protein product [Rotaria socialis]CAF3387640.1 unnamed protein product [Rotaria socialis]CAF3621085.1 unnamed protein product [Rotaria socialis]CAF4115749.1 unnamed protein product [Rotaria socialis]